MCLSNEFLNKHSSLDAPLKLLATASLVVAVLRDEVSTESVPFFSVNLVRSTAVVARAEELVVKAEQAPNSQCAPVPNGSQCC